MRKKRTNSVATEALNICSQGEDLDSCVFSWSDLVEDLGELLDCDPGTRMEGLVVQVVIDVLVSPSSVVTEFCDGVSLESDWELVEPQSLFFLRTTSVGLGGEFLNR